MATVKYWKHPHFTPTLRGDALRFNSYCNDVKQNDPFLHSCLEPQKFYTTLIPNEVAQPRPIKGL